MTENEDDWVLRELEFAVDLHTFEPADAAAWARDAGFATVRVETEELLASLAGWAVRTIEAGVRPGVLGDRWSWFAYRMWKTLYRVDRLLYTVVPKRLFYNLLLFAEKPGS